MKSYSLHTPQIDDPELALQDILAQADALVLHKHTVGLAVCHYDFINGGIIQALARALPFPLIGITTFYQVTPAVQGLFALTVTVLTSDDVCFSIASSGDVSDDLNPADVVASTYQRAYGVHGRPPALILSFLSVKRPISGDEYLRLLDENSGGVPSFGSVTISEDDAGTNAYLICGDTISESGFALLMLTGDVEAKYYFDSYREEKMLDITAVATAAQGTWVERLNGEPAVAFLRKNGFFLNDANRDKVCNVPFFCRRPGEPYYLGRTLGSFDGEKGLRFLGEVPQGSILRVGTASMEETVAIASSVARKAAAESPRAALMLVFSCIGRYITLGLDPTLEMEKTTGLLPEAANYLACYVAGEICPIAKDSGLVNRYHNVSFVVCALR